MSPRSWHSRLFTKISQLCQFRGCHLFRPPLPGDERPRARDPHPDRHRGLRPAVLQVAAPRGPSRPTSHESLEPVRIRSEEPNFDYRRENTGYRPRGSRGSRSGLQHQGHRPRPEALARITERADQVRQETLKQFGVQEIGAEIVRTMHDPELNQRPDTGLKAPPTLGGSAMVARPTRRQVFGVN